ncbi:MAG: hypothetical protein IPG55_05230 [Saprospiraceae bacterium]|nr:hypothetical protein [Candidatus Defluviibacterium haderslevense]
MSVFLTLTTSLSHNPAKIKYNIVLCFIYDVRLSNISTLASERISGSVDDLFGRKSVI